MGDTRRMYQRSWSANWPSGAVHWHRLQPQPGRSQKRTQSVLNQLIICVRSSQEPVLYIRDFSWALVSSDLRVSSPDDNTSLCIRANHLDLPGPDVLDNQASPRRRLTRERRAPLM